MSVSDIPISGLPPAIGLTGQEAVPVVQNGATVQTTTAQFRGIPQNIQNQNYQLALTDAGEHVYHTQAGANTYTIPANATVAFGIGATVTIINDVGAGVITIAPAVGVTLLQAGTANTGNRSLAAQGMATMIKIGADRWMINGAGLT